MTDREVLEELAEWCDYDRSGFPCAGNAIRNVLDENERLKAELDSANQELLVRYEADAGVEELKAENERLKQEVTLTDRANEGLRIENRQLVAECRRLRAEVTEANEAEVAGGGDD